MGYIFIFLTFVIWRVCDARQSVSIIAVVPYTSFSQTKYVKYFSHVVSSEKLSRWNRKFTYRAKYEMVENYNPPEILNKLCKVIVKHKANAIAVVMNIEDLSNWFRYMILHTSFLRIPVIAWYPENLGLFKTPADALALQLGPSYYHQVTAMFSFMKRYEWSKFSVIASFDEGHHQFMSTIEDITKEPQWKDFEILDRIEISNYNQAYIEKQLEVLKISYSRIVILFSSSENRQSILEAAHKMGFTKEEYLWIITQVKHKSDISRHETLPVGSIGLTFEHKSSEMFNQLKVSAQIWANAVKDVLKKEGDSANNTLVPITACDGSYGNTGNSGERFFEYLRNTTVQINGIPSGFKSDGTLQDTQIKLVNLVYRSHKKGRKKWKEIGTWKASGLTTKDITWPGNSPKPPLGKPAEFYLRITTLHEEPYVLYSDPDPERGTCDRGGALCRMQPRNVTDRYPNATRNNTLYKCCSGFAIDLLNKLSEKMNIQYELFQVDDKNWGGNSTGEWNGLVRTLMDNKADMSMTSLKINPERASVIDFSVPFLETGITIIVSVRDGAISPTAFLEPYDYPAWCVIIIFSVHASGTSVFIFEWLSPSGLNRGERPLREHKFSLFRSFWLIWAMLFGAAVNTDSPRGVSGRFMANVWALFAVVFLASYTANLAAFMITKEDYYDIKGIQDWRLREPNRLTPPFKFATTRNGNTEANIRKNHPDIFRHMKPNNKTNVEEGLDSLKKNEIQAFIYDATVLEYKASHDKGCKLRTVGNWYAMTGYGVGFPKGSIWKPKIDKHLLQMQNSGDIERLQRYWFGGACKKSSERADSSHPLKIVNFTSAYILLAGGIVLGVLLMILEHCYFKWFRKNLKNWDKCGCCGLISLSMGKSLTFEQSVMEAIDLHRNFKCKNPVCETNTWKIRHELDLALLRVERLQIILRDYNLEPEKRANNNNPNEQTKAITHRPYSADDEVPCKTQNSDKDNTVHRRKMTKNYAGSTYQPVPVRNTHIEAIETVL